MNTGARMILVAVSALCAAALAATTGVRAAEDETEDLAPPEIVTTQDSGQDGGQDSDKDSGTGSDAASAQAPPPYEVRQRQAYGQTITEYERGGDVFMMTVKPRTGWTQYWNDPDGDGQFQRSTSDDIDENMNLPKWRLGGW